MGNLSERLYYMDNLRAVIMIAGVFFHAALAYVPALSNVWLTSGSDNSLAIAALADFSHLFRMPLFFVIAGFFTALLIQCWGIGAMFKNRLRRILLPFLIFWPIVVASIGLPIVWALENIENLSPILSTIKKMQGESGQQSSLSLTHLWFLYYLMFFYVLTWVFRQLPLTTTGNWLLSLNPLQAIFILPLLLVPSLCFGIVPYPAPESFIPQLWAIGFFGSFFAYGYLLFFSSRLLSYFETRWMFLLITSILLFIPFFLLSPDNVTLEFKNPPWEVRLPLILLTAFISVWMSITGIVVAKKLLSQGNAFLRYMSDASYWIYIIHLPIVLMVQYYLLDTNWGSTVEFLISSFGTLAICTISYVLLVRWTPIGWLLNGKRRLFWPSLISASKIS